MKEKFIHYKTNCKLWPWNSRMTEHIHWTMTRSKIKNGKIAPKHSNQWENAINGETCLSKESELLSPLTPPPPLPQNQGDLCSFLITWTPLSILWKIYPLDLGNWWPLSKKIYAIIGLSREIYIETNTANKDTPFPQKWEHTCYSRP